MRVWLSILGCCALAIVGCKDDSTEGELALGELYRQPAPHAVEDDVAPTFPKPVEVAEEKPRFIHYDRRDQPVPKMETSPHDIIGLKLGMTPQQAVTILDEHFQDNHGRGGLNFSYFDQIPLQKGKDRPKRDLRHKWGYKHNSTKYDFSDPRYVMTVIQGGDGTHSVGLRFALPPEPNVLIGITRTAHHHDAQKNEGTSYEIFTKALQDKYGQASGGGETLKANRAEVAGINFKWLASGADCGGTIPRQWGTAKGTPSNLPAPEHCGTLLQTDVYYYQSGPYKGMVSTSTTNLANYGNTFLNEQRHQAWLVATKANWENARNEQIRAASKDTKAPTL